MACNISKIRSERLKNHQNCGFFGGFNPILKANCIISKCSVIDTSNDDSIVQNKLQQNKNEHTWMHQNTRWTHLEEGGLSLPAMWVIQWCGEALTLTLTLVIHERLLFSSSLVLIVIYLGWVHLPTNFAFCCRFLKFVVWCSHFQIYILYKKCYKTRPYNILVLFHFIN